MEEEFIEPTKEGKKILLLRIIVGILLVFLYDLLFKQLWLDYLHLLPICEKLQWSKYLYLVNFTIPSFFAIIMLFYIKKINKFNQFPLKNTLVFKKTLIKKDNDIKKYSKFLYCLSLFCFFITIICIITVNNMIMFKNTCNISLFKNN